MITKSKQEIFDQYSEEITIWNETSILYLSFPNFEKAAEEYANQKLNSRDAVDDNNELKKILMDVIISNYRLGKAEYDRNPLYSDSHYHAKAEKALIDYLQENHPAALEEIISRISDIENPLAHK